MNIPTIKQAYNAASKVGKTTLDIASSAKNTLNDKFALSEKFQNVSKKVSKHKEATIGGIVIATIGLLAIKCLKETKEAFDKIRSSKN